MKTSPDTADGKRFAFGKNWTRFLATIDESRIQHAMDDIAAMLEVQSLAGQRFLDIGCGSGLSSLAARRLGATVHSFDFDPDCVRCASELRQRYFPDDPHWSIEQGSALDRGYVQSLGSFDVVYSWGVLHHTGRMWEAIDNACLPAGSRGQLFLSIYNDQGPISELWGIVKKAYCHTPTLLRPLIVLPIALTIESLSFVRACVLGRPLAWLWQRFRGQAARGMNLWYDWVDWIGGYPFEVAKPEEVFDFCRQRGFALQRLETVGGRNGCNCLVFQRTSQTERAGLDDSARRGADSTRAAA